jgi:uncharacterized protein (TIGR01244 family)
MQILRGTALLAFSSFAGLSFPVWATDVAAPGVPNFHQVDHRVYRGAQPNANGWDSLAKLGIKIIVDLRPQNEHSCKEERREVEAAGMHYVNVPLGGLSAPPDDTISRLLALLTGSPDPVFIHCRRGADRTGTVIACYRIAHDGWSNRKALKEAKADGMSWIEMAMQRYVLGFHSVSPQLAGHPTQPSSSTLN